jgi:hypothetical protein
LKTALKALVAALILLTAFVGTYLAAVDLYHADLVNVHSLPQSGMPVNSTSASDMWFSQDLSLGPAAGSVNVRRDTVLVINEPRPVGVENITFNPPVAIAERLDEHFPVASAKITVFPAGLLEPNTTYNVTATIGDKLVWWSFTTGAEPQQQLNTVNTSMQTITWYALAAASLTTLLAAACIVLFLRRRRKHA